MWQQNTPPLSSDSPPHLGLLPLCKGEDSLAVLVPPAPPGQRVEDDGVVIAAVVEAGVEVQGQVVGVVTDVDGEAGREAEVRGQKGVPSLL